MEMRMPSVRWPDAPADSTDAGGAPSTSQAGVIRTWLATGARMFIIDPRRGRGRHGQARQMLVDSSEVVPSGDGVWRDTVSALRRHTVLNSLAQLSQEDRQVLTFAYLLGHTNREIAAMLSVSVSTVGRRLSAALARLEEQVLRTGNWVSTLALLALSFVRTRTRSLAHLMTNANTPVSTGSFAAAAAGVATVVTLSFVALSPDAPSSKLHSSPATYGPSVTVPLTGKSSTSAGLTPVPRTASIPPGQLLISRAASGQSTNQSGSANDPGCGGNPTSAAPSVPVGSRTNLPRGAPVTHPTKGGCGPHGTEAA